MTRTAAPARTARIRKAAAAHLRRLRALLIAMLIAVAATIDPRRLLRRGPRRRLPFHDEVLLRTVARPGIDQLAEYLRKYALFEEHCRRQRSVEASLHRAGQQPLHERALEREEHHQRHDQ
jgi:hypothetical protein